MRIFEDMKKFFTITMLMLVLVACKNPVQQLSGSYSYKISGTAKVRSVSINLSDEIGTLDILRKTDSTAVLTFNVMGGPVYCTNATVKGKDIELDPFNRRVTQSVVGYDVMVIGNGKLYDESIIFNLRYVGTTLNADSLLMVCKKNQP